MLGRVSEEAPACFVDAVRSHVIPRYAGGVSDARGGVRWVLPDKAVYWESADQ
jgi:hypothetical protein